MTDARPATCRFRLHDEGKAYPKSSCTECGRGIATGLGKSCHKVGPIPTPEGDPVERLRGIWERDDFVEGPMPLFIASFVSGEIATARNEVLDEAKAGCAEYKKSHDVVMEQHGNSDYHANCSAASGRCVDIIEDLKTEDQGEP